MEETGINREVLKEICDLAVEGGEVETRWL